MTARRTLITIICEESLERPLGDDVMRLGAHGYTVTEARGRGHRGVRDGAWSPSGNIRMEVICEHAVAEAISEHLRSAYFAHYALVLYLSEVTVLRENKF
jgi:hypothetical protein